MTYSHEQIEKKWQQKWIEKKIFHPNLLERIKKKFYLLDMFPYPSGKGLHVGHLRGYLATDVLTRMKMMQGYNVFHPIGFDSFGLPAERYAVRTGNDPYKFTEKNIAFFIKQLQSFGFAYDYDRVIKTHDPKYFKWTQWTFGELFKHHLAVKKLQKVYYSQKLKTVLSKEEILDLYDPQKENQYAIQIIDKKQWVVKIDVYAEELLKGLKTLQSFWPQRILEMQRFWIGKKNGYLLKFLIINQNNQLSKYKEIFCENIKIFPFLTHLTISLTNEIFDDLLSLPFLKSLQEKRRAFYLQPSFKKKGSFSNLFLSNLIIMNPFTNKKITIFYATQEEKIAYFYQNQTSQKLFNFQKKSDLEYQKIEEELQKSDLTKILKDLTFQKIILQKKTTYRLKDWVFARQRYWGEPFPLYYQDQKIKIIPLEELPLKLPKISKALFLKRDHQTPLQRISTWKAKGYDEDVMPQWAGSCWYFIGYLLKKPDGTFWPLNSLYAKKILNKWIPVDIYVGGAEHAVLHLLYARFWNRFLVNIKCYDVQEPFKKLINQGLVLDAHGKKMSKSKGNVVNPSDFLETHGADAMRLHINFSGTFTNDLWWEEKNLDAMRKWLARVYRLFVHYQDRFVIKKTSTLSFINAKTIKDVTSHIESFAFNSALASLMTFINVCYQKQEINIHYGEDFLKLLYPFAPHLCEEIWWLWKKDSLLIHQKWPTYEKKALEKTFFNLQVQFNGKFKFVLKVKKDFSREEVIAKLCKEKMIFMDFLRQKFFQKKIKNALSSDAKMILWKKYLQSKKMIIFKKNWFLNFLIF